MWEKNYIELHDIADTLTFALKINSSFIWVSLMYISTASFPKWNPRTSVFKNSFVILYLTCRTGIIFPFSN